MRSLREATVGDVALAFRKYRPFVLTLVGVLLLAFVTPGRRESSVLDAPAVRSSAPPSATGRSLQPDSAAGEALVPAGEAPVAAQTSDAVERPSRALSAVSDTADALTAPDCDPATGRIKMPSFYVIYAPNCVRMWPKDADNGGATSLGVTKDTVTVAIYIPEDSANSQQAQAIFSATGFEDPTSDEEDDANRKKVVEALEHHFETYGRRVKWVKLHASGPPNDETAARADAVRVATEINAFASLRDPSLSGGGNAYIEELVARGVMCIRCTPGQPQDNWLRWDPYAFSDFTSTHQVFVHIGEYYGKRVANRPAKWAGDPLLQQKTRTLGLIQYTTTDDVYRHMPDFLDSQLQQYGAQLADRVSYVLDLPQAQEQARVIMSRFKDRGITTVLCYCDPITIVFFSKEATNQQYFPEWGLVAAPYVDTALFARLYDQTQWAHAFGLAKLATRMDPSVEENEVNPVSWHYGGPLTSYPDMADFGLLLTGIHLAGPKLTPHSFRDGMFSLKPASGFLTRIGVSFGNHGLWPWPDFHAADDTEELWWDVSERGPDELGAQGTGMYRYIDMGKRYLPGQWPTTEPRAFDTDDTVLVYDERPPQDLLPDYDHKDYRGG